MQTLVRGGTVVTCDARDRVVTGDVLLEGDRIVAIGDVSRALKRPARLVDASGCAVMPGFVQAHVHLCQTLMRGMADDLPLLEWLRIDLAARSRARRRDARGAARSSASRS